MARHALKSISEALPGSHFRLLVAVVPFSPRRISVKAIGARMAQCCPQG
jgi:hypothetical protein